MWWQCWRPRFDPWIRKIPWSRTWQPTPVFLPGEFHGQRSLAGYSPWGHKESDMTEQLTLSLYTFSHPYMITGKRRALTIHTFVGKVVSLFFSMLPRFVSFPSKEQVSFNFMATVTVRFGAQVNKICHCFHFFPFLFAMK